MKPESKQGDDGEMQTGEWEKKSHEEADGSGDDSDNAAIAGKSQYGDDSDNAAIAGKSQYEINKENNIKKIKQKLAELEAKYPVPNEFAQKKLPKAPAVKKGKQVRNEPTVRRESQRGKDKTA